ncbi:hypothetical protein [Geomonas terrae]|uniref:hypothetical protein n=1 Tax=Geomonas terrae TaxID=2562681 RepID=UPI0013A5E6A4|nr:hypothetical protein [Geomonas terrae]
MLSWKNHAIRFLVCFTLAPLPSPACTPDTPYANSTVGEDGELYLADYDSGTIYRVGVR